MHSASKVSIKPLTSIDDIRGVIALERAAWGYSDLDLDSFSILTIVSKFSGQLLGAFENDNLVGFAVSLCCLESTRLHSHRVGVLPEFQNMGVGYDLKLAQRKYAMEAGIKVIQWTFDPLQPRNAHFNLNKLGGMARAYIPNIYGITSSPLNAGLPTDRLLIEWELYSERVYHAIAGRVLRANLSDIRIPLNSTGLRDRTEVQRDIRQRLTAALEDGYAVMGFEQSENPSYVLQKVVC